MAEPTLQQTQDAVNYINAYVTAFASGANEPAAPSSGDPTAVILGALGFYPGPYTGTINSTALLAGYKQFLHDYDPTHYDPNMSTIDYDGGPPIIYGELFHGLQNALAAVQGGAAAPGGESTGMTTYVVQSGDTLSSIANSFGISLESLEDANPQIPNFDDIFVGQVINVPNQPNSTTLVSPSTTPSTPAATTFQPSKGPVHTTGAAPGAGIQPPGAKAAASASLPLVAKIGLGGAALAALALAATKFKK